MPAIVRTPGSSEPREVTSVRAAAGDPVVRNRAFEANSRAVWRSRTGLVALRLQHRRDVELLPVRRIVGGEMVEPERQDVLGDSLGVLEAELLDASELDHLDDLRGEQTLELVEALLADAEDPHLLAVIQQPKSVIAGEPDDG